MYSCVFVVDVLKYFQSFLKGSITMSYVDETLEKVIAQNPNQPEFHQAVKEVLEMYYETKTLLERHGYERYEISNYAKPGYECNRK